MGEVRRGAVGEAQGVCVRHPLNAHYVLVTSGRVGRSGVCFSLSGQPPRRLGTRPHKAEPTAFWLLSSSLQLREKISGKVLIGQHGPHVYSWANHHSREEELPRDWLVPMVMANT